jgi:hypothetical protein
MQRGEILLDARRYGPRSGDFSANVFDLVKRWRRAGFIPGERHATEERDTGAFRSSDTNAVPDQSNGSNTIRLYGVVCEPSGVIVPSGLMISTSSVPLMRSPALFSFSRMRTFSWPKYAPVLMS